MTRVRAALVGFAFLLLTAGCASLGNSEYAASPTPYPNYVDNSIFNAQLDPYGTWVEVQPFGLCWIPDNVPWGWRPYSQGYWATTDYGWTWISDEPWGWATYHYGRWLDDQDYGWVWVPGNEWAPAWVAWRSNDEWVGWAALPPAASWSPDGLSGYDESAIPADQWCFVRGHRMLNQDLGTAMAPTVRNEVLIGRTHDVTRFTVYQGRPVNHGVELANVERLAGRRPPQLTIVDMQRPESGHAQEVQGATVRMFRTTLRPTSQTTNVNAHAQPQPHAQPHPAPRPPATAPKPIATAEQLEQQRETQQRQAQAVLDRERQELAVEQADELKQAKTATAQQQIMERQAAERKALEERTQRQNQLLQAQLKRRFVKAGGDTTKVKPTVKTMLNLK